MAARSLAAFLLCAGYGRRLLPLTERIAKPAIPFLGQSALERSRRAIETLSPQRWLVNTHHLPEQIGFLAKKLDLEVLHEPEILGTGGCIANAASILQGYDAFLIHNADLIHTFDLKALWASHLSSGAVATLAGIHRPPLNTLSVDAAGRLLGVHGYQGYRADPALNQQSNLESTRLTFAGVAFYQREFLGFLSPGCEDIKHYWMRALNAGDRIQVVDCSEAAWHDFGTPQSLWEAARFVMDSAGEFNYNYPSPRDSRAYVSNEVSNEISTEISNEAGEKDLPEDLRNVLLYEKTKTPIPKGTHNRILGKDFEWEIAGEIMGEITGEASPNV